MSHLVPLPLPCPVQLGTVKADASGSQLHQFVREGSHTKVKKILMKGVAVDTRNSLGQTPLFIAALLDLVKVVDVLLMFGADPNHRCDDRSTPVHAAAFSCNQWILSKLLDAGGDLRLNDKDGRLPQVWAQSAGKEKSVRILEFMQRCTSHMQEITQQVSCSISHQIGSSSESLMWNSSILNKITHRVKDGEFLSNPKARNISSQTVQCFGFGKFYVLGSTQLAYLASIPLVSEKALVQPDDEPTFSYTTGPYTTMTNLTWNGIRVTVKQMNRPTHLNCSKRLSADLLITEQEYSSHLRHPSLLLLMAVCQLSELDQIRLVYERVNLGSLYGVLHERRSEFPVLHMEMIVQMLLQITDALLYLHSWGYIHRTVTSHAVQLVLPGIAKLSNFEFMVKSVDGGIYNNLSQFPIPSQFYNWLAPEVIRGRTATVKSDVYSFCTLVQELFTDTVPWEDLDGFAVKELLAAGRCLTVDDQVPKPYYDIVRMGIQVKPQNRTMNLQDIRFVLRNDFKDLISNKKKDTSEKDQSDLCLHGDVNMFETNGVDHRREQEQLQKENDGKGKQPECLEQAQLTSDNDEYSYYNLGRRTSFSPKKCAADNKVRHLNSEPSQQITVLYDCWKTEHNQFDGKAESRAHHGVYFEDKAGNDSNPCKKIGQHYDSESSEPLSEKHYSDVLGHLRELDLALDEEIFATSDEEGASIISLKTGREYTSDEGDEQSDRTTTLSQDWSGIKSLEGDQENHGMVCQRNLNSSMMEEEDIATSISVQDSISSCKMNIQTSKHLMQQAFSALTRTMRSYNPKIGIIQKSKKQNQISDQIEKTPFTHLLGCDEVDHPRQNAKGNKQIKSSINSHLMIPTAVAPPACYQLPVSGVEKIHEANPAGHFQPTFEVLGHTEDERTAGAEGCCSDILKTSETFADGTQTTCSLKKQENVEGVDYKFTREKSAKSMPGHKDKPTVKCKKKMNVIAQVHEHEDVPVRKGRISVRIPPHGDQQGSRKQCMYLSGNRKIRITQSCNVVAEGVKVRQRTIPEGYHFTNMEKPQGQFCGRTAKGKSKQASVSTNWTSDMTNVIEKMTSGCLPVGQGESKQQNRLHTEHVHEEELFRQFAKQRRQSVKQPHPSNSHLVHSVEGHMDHQQMKYNSYYTPEKAHIESDSSLEMEKSLQSFTGEVQRGSPSLFLKKSGQRVSFDSYQSGDSEEERQITNMDKTFATGRKQNGAQKENVQHFSPSDSSFNKSDEFFTPNSELLSLYSETSTNEELTENQLAKESADSEEEFAINREVCQKNTVSLRSSSGSDIDVVRKEVIGKVMERRNSNRDWNEVTILSPTAAAGSFSDIQEFSCIPCDRCSMDKMCSKTPLCSGGPIDNSTPHSVITGRNVSSGSCPHRISFESLLLLQSKIVDTSLWQSTESSAISPETFGASCEDANEVQNPITLPAATSVSNIAKCQMEQECRKTCAATPNPPTQLTEEKAKSTAGIVLKLVEDEKDEGTVPKQMQETLDHLGDCEWCRMQKSLEESQRAHSTLDSILEAIESPVQSKEEIIKNQASSEEALRMLQKAESGSTGNQTNTTAREESTGDAGTSASITSSTGESSNKKAIERTNWTQPHRIIILK